MKSSETDKILHFTEVDIVRVLSSFFLMYAFVCFFIVFFKQNGLLFIFGNGRAE